MITAVLDVNVLVSALLTPRGTPCLVLTAWEQQRFRSVTSEHIIADASAKLSRPDLGGAYGVTQDDIGWVRALLQTQAEIVTIGPVQVVPVTGDPEDDIVLATAVVGRATYLVTGDKGLLNLGSCADVLIVSPREFLQVLEQSEQSQGIHHP